MSAFYRVPREHVPAELTASSADVVLLYASAGYFYLCAPEERADVAAAYGAELLGLTWLEFWHAAPQVRDFVFLATVKRAGERMRVRLADVEPTDLVIASPIPPVRFAGQPAPVPIRP